MLGINNLAGFGTNMLPSLFPATPTVFESASTGLPSVSAMSGGINPSKAVVAYRDDGNSSFGTACILDISGSTITPGTAVVFESANTSHISVNYLDSGSAIVAYSDVGNGEFGTACVLSISGTTITPGTPVVFESAITNFIAVDALNFSSAIVAYGDLGNSGFGTAMVLSISGTTVTANTPVVFESAAATGISVSTVNDTNKAIVCYTDVGNSSYGTACILDVSGTTVTPGTPVVFESALTNNISVAMLSATKAIVTYRDGGNSNYGTACILDISGSTITPGTPFVFSSSTVTNTSVQWLDSTKAVVTYRDSGNSSFGTARILNVLGSNITTDAPVVFESALTVTPAVTVLSSNKAVVAYADNGNSSYGTACILNYA